MELIQGERKVATSNEYGLTVTTHRVWKEVETWGLRAIRTGMLENIDHCWVAYRSRPVYGVVAVVSLLIGMVNPLKSGGVPDQVSFLIGSIIAALFGFAFRESRGTKLMIGTSSGQISLRVSGDQYDSMTDLIRRIQEARDKRLRSLAISTASMPASEPSASLQALSSAVPSQ
jgi:hypothetical protein